MWTKHRERCWPECETYSPGDPALDFICTRRLFSCFPRSAQMFVAVAPQTTSHQPTHRRQWFILRERLKLLSFTVVYAFIRPPLEKGIVNELMDFLKLLLKQQEWTSKLKGKVTSPDTYRFNLPTCPSSIGPADCWLCVNGSCTETFKSPGFWLSGLCVSMSPVTRLLLQPGCCCLGLSPSAQRASALPTQNTESGEGSVKMNL